MQTFIYIIKIIYAVIFIISIIGVINQIGNETKSTVTKDDVILGIVFFVPLIIILFRDL